MMWCDNINFDEVYTFKSSPESSSDNSFSTDNMDYVSDEDFMAQLSSDLDIPLLLNQGEDEMAVLNSFLDKTPDELLSDTKSSDLIENTNLGVTENLSQLPTCKYATFENSLKLSTPPDEDKSITYFDFLNGALNPFSNDDCAYIKSEEHSDESCSLRSNSSNSPTPPPMLLKKECNMPGFTTNILPKKQIHNGIEPASIRVVPQSNNSIKVPVKRVPIKPKTYTLPPKNSNFVLIKNIKPKFANVNLKGANIGSSNIVVLDNIHINPFNTLTSTLTPTFNHVSKPDIMPSISVNASNGLGVDPKILKRHERRIKNRESASISRKKKKDYLNSLEEQVKVLVTENKQLVSENAFLRERLSYYENGNKLSFNNVSHKGAKPALVLCALLLIVGLNINLTRSPVLTKLNKVDPQSNNYPKLINHYGRNLLWDQEDKQGDKLKNSTYFSPLTMCPASINQSESARLLLELEKWIGKPEPVKIKAEYFKSTYQKPKVKRKKMRLDSSLVQVKQREQYGPQNEVKNEIQVFSPNGDQLYSEFFEAINRQNDTFYVVSFSEQHMLLPALHHNDTRRPKMSLLIPSVFPNETSTQTYIPLMQIDCEVLDAKLVNVKYGSIPRPYRHYGNFTKANDERKRNSDYTSRKKMYKPYFLSKNVLKAVDFD